MKKAILFFTLLPLLLIGCSIDQEEGGDLPEVDVDTESGNLPEYDVDWANVDVSTETKMVEVPKVVVVMEEEEVEVPSIDMNIPDKETVERNLVVEAEITGTQKSIEIQEIRASQNRMYVIATLEEMDTNLEGKTMRIQDQVELNAPKDLDVRYIIVGQKPNRVYNDKHSYVNSMDDLDSEIKDAAVIYQN